MFGKMSLAKINILYNIRVLSKNHAAAADDLPGIFL